jgi:hypothetical protein
MRVARKQSHFYMFIEKHHAKLPKVDCPSPPDEALHLTCARCTPIEPVARLLGGAVALVATARRQLSGWPLS